MRSVRIPEWAASAALHALERLGGFVHKDAAEAIRRAMAPKKFVKAARKEKTAKKKAHNAETSDIRAEVFARAGGLCEMCKGAEPTDLQHTMGRIKRRQSVTNTLAICRPCHRAATAKTPEVLRLQAMRLYVMGHKRASLDLEELAEWLEVKTTARLSLGGART